MATVLPLSPSFVPLSTAMASSSDSIDSPMPVTPKVRFDQECVLIPDPVPISRIPRLGTKSYSLPLWRRKRDPSIVSDSEDDPLEEHVVFKVSVPRLITKPRSPSRDLAAHRPLVSCLVYADSSPSSSPSSSLTTSTSRTGRPRRASLPAPVQSNVITVPLRACCAQCYHSIDKCMKEGEHWEVHFSRGALRRRKSVSDTHTPSRTRHCVRDAMPGFDTVVVDEIDQRRRSTDVDALTAFTVDISVGVEDDTASTGLEEVPLPLRRAMSLPDAPYPNCANFLPGSHPRVLSPPILEEEEHRLSPRRTPIPSPLSSSTNLPLPRSIYSAQTTNKVSKTLDSPPLTHASSELDSVYRSSPINLTPPVLVDRSPPSSYFPASYPMPQRTLSFDSPSSSPSSSPRAAHARSTSAEAPGMPRKRSIMQLPETIFRASSSVLKGISGMGGMPV